jgi:hypothetical protein
MPHDPVQLVVCILVLSINTIGLLYCIAVLMRKKQ